MYPATQIVRTIYGTFAMCRDCALSMLKEKEYLQTAELEAYVFNGVVEALTSLTSIK